MRLTIQMVWIVTVAACGAFAGYVPPTTAPATSAAPSSTWYWQNPLPRGYQLSAIACGSATRCVAAGIDGSIATTADGGKHWANRTTGIGITLSFLSCPGSTVCYALGSQGPWYEPQGPYVLFRSTDGGASWQAASHPQVGTQQGVSDFTCPGPTTCLAGLGPSDQPLPHATSILRTADGGKTWQRVHLAGVRWNVTVACATSTVCYAGGLGKAHGRLFRSVDGGKTWSGHALKPPGLIFGIECPGAETCFATSRTCPAPDECRAILRTTNGARSWKWLADIQTPLNQFSGNLACPTVTTCYMISADASNYYNTSVVVTANGGRTWSVRHLPDSAGEIVCPRRTVCLLNAGFAVLATRDGFGHTEETLARSVLHNLTLSDVSCPSTTTCYTAGFRGVCHSHGEECDQAGSPGAATTDGGRTWTTTSAPPDSPLPCPDFYTPCPIQITRLSCPGDDVCYGIAGERGATQYLERSDDGTRTWQRVFPSEGLFADLTDISCPSVSTCYVTSFGAGDPRLALFVTRDGGKTWTAQHEVDALAPGTAGQTDPRALASVTCLSITTCFVLAASFHQVSQSQATVALLLTSDGGTTWSRKGVPDMSADAPGYFSPPLACPTVTTCYLLPSNGAANDPGSTGDVLVTTDGGTGWRQSVVQAGSVLTDIACPTAQACRVAGEDGIFATADGGKTWQKQPMADGSSVPQLSSIACPAADTCYAVGGPFTIVGTRPPAGTPSGSFLDFRRPPMDSRRTANAGR